MGMQRKNITLTEQQDDWVKAQIGSGHLGKDSEYIRDLIRKDQQAKERLTMLRQALLEGESSGESKALDLAEIKALARELFVIRVLNEDMDAPQRLLD